MISDYTLLWLFFMISVSFVILLWKLAIHFYLLSGFIEIHIYYLVVQVNHRVY